MFVSQRLAGGTRLPRPVHVRKQTGRFGCQRRPLRWKEERGIQGGGSWPAHVITSQWSKRVRILIKNTKLGVAFVWKMKGTLNGIGIERIKMVHDLDDRIDLRE